MCGAQDLSKNAWMNSTKCDDPKLKGWVNITCQQISNRLLTILNGR